jgi:hypothetical protein
VRCGEKQWFCGCIGNCCRFNRRPKNGCEKE